MKKTITLKDGSKAILRDLKKSDSPKQLMDYINTIIDEDTYLTMNEKQTLDEEEKWLQKNIEMQREKKAVTLVLEYKGTIMGTARATKCAYKESCNVEIGISVSKELRDQGVGTIMMQSIIDEIKKRLDPYRIFLYVFGNNKRGIRVYEKTGFKTIAVLKRWFRHKGKYVDKVIMELKE